MLDALAYGLMLRQAQQDAMTHPDEESTGSINDDRYGNTEDQAQRELGAAINNDDDDDEDD